VHGSITNTHAPITLDALRNNANAQHVNLFDLNLPEGANGALSAKVGDIRVETNGAISKYSNTVLTPGVALYPNATDLVGQRVFGPNATPAQMDAAVNGEKRIRNLPDGNSVLEVKVMGL
jgi:hypothetical protein